MTAWLAAFEAANAAEFACRSASIVLEGRARRQALARAATHAAARTRIQTLISDPAELPATPPAYLPAEELVSAADGRALITRTENALVPVFADAAAASTGPDRSWAVDQAIDCAVTAVRWGGSSAAFPQALSADDVPAQPQDQ
jgi:hypothetical protein